MAEPLSVPAGTPSPGRVLIVDDDALLMQALASRLDASGHEVRLVREVSEALRLLEGIEVAVVDLGLPPKPDSPEEGLRLVSTLATTHPEIVTVVQSGQDEEAAAFQALAAGAWDFLAKPVSPDEFDAVVERALRRARHTARLAASGRYLPAGPAYGGAGLKEVGDAAQERLLRQVLAVTHFNVAETARRLGLQRERLYYYLDKFGIRRPENIA